MGFWFGLIQNGQLAASVATKEVAIVPERTITTGGLLPDATIVSKNDQMPLAVASK
jgi:hypothetical protein